MSMSRKDFIEVSDTIYHVRADYEALEGDLEARRAIFDVANSLANSFLNLNGNFNKKKFLLACGFSVVDAK